MASASSVSTVSTHPEGLEKMDGPGQTIQHNFAASSIVTVLVGSNRVPYHAHKETLIKYCPFFAKCLDSGMKEECSNEVEFPGDTCLAFDLFFLWIYRREVPKADGHDKVLAAMNAWVLGDKFCMPDWQNPLIDSIMSFWKSNPMAPDHLAWLYDNAGQSSQLLMLGSKQLVWNIVSKNELYEDEEEWAAALEGLMIDHACSPAKLLCSVHRETKLARINLRLRAANIIFTSTESVARMERRHEGR